MQDEILLFTTRTCPNCAQAARLLEAAGIEYVKLVAEENPEQAKLLGIRQAPTLVAGTERAAGLGPIRKWISAR